MDFHKGVFNVTININLLEILFNLMDFHRGIFNVTGTISLLEILFYFL